MYVYSVQSFIKRDRVKISHMPNTTLNSVGISPYLAIQTTPQGNAVICATQMIELKLREISTLPKMRELVCGTFGIRSKAYRPLKPMLLITSI